MLLPTEAIASAQLGDVQPGSLFLAVQYAEPTLFWVLSDADDAFAVMLNGAHAGEAFKSSGNKHWSGLTIGTVELRVDPSSAHLGQTESRLQLRAAQGALALPVTVKRSGFRDGAWIKIQDIKTARDNSIYFRRWALGITAHHDEWVAMASLSDGELTSPCSRPSLCLSSDRCALLPSS